eukprot:s1138_g3.t1
MRAAAFPCARSASSQPQAFRRSFVLHLRSRRLAPHASSAHSAVPALLAAGFVFARRVALPPLRGNRYVAMQAAPDVVIYSRPGCAYCAKAKSLLKQRSVSFGVVDIAAEEERRAEALERSKASTVPQVFVGSRCLGGFDDLRRLDEAGRLLEALKRSPEDDVYIRPTPPEKIAAAGLPEAVRSQLSERAQVLSKLKYQAGSKPSLGAFLRYAVTSTPKQDQSRNVPLNLAAAPGQPSPGPALQGNASELVALLRQVMLQLLEDFFDPASADVDYMAMRASPQWSLFLALAAEIGEPRLRPELEALGESDRKAFFINLYNAMTFHGVATFGRRSGWWYLYCFFITPAVSYRVAGVQMSLDDIEHGILRAKKGYFEAPGLNPKPKPEKQPGYSVLAACHGVKRCGGYSADEGRNPCGYRPEQYVVSETVGPNDDFRMRLVVYPRGRYHYKDDCDLLSAFLEILPPVILEGCRWRCEDIHFELTALKEDEADVKPWKTGTFTFSDSCRFAGLCDICDMDEVAEEGIWLNRLQELRMRGQATCAPPSPKGRLEQVELILRDLETMQDIGSEWIVQDAKCEVTVYQEGADWVVKEAATFCFTDEESGNGWSELWPRPLQDLASWVGLGRLVVQASVEFPLPTDALKDLYQGLDFSQEVTQVTVRLAEGPPLFFDKRVLMACSEYFRDMLEEPRFREGCNNEIDLSCDPQADHRAVSAIFRYMTSGTFFANGDFTFALSIRKLADQYRLTGLVEKAETELGSLLSENNVLMFLSHVFGTGCRLEQLCVQMIMNNGCEVLVLQEEQLTQMVDAHPELAKKLMRALLAARSQLRWPEGSGKELQRQLRMPEVDPRIHMALNCGAKGCPAVAVYTGGEGLDAELDSAVAGFVAAEGNVRIKEEASGLRLDVSEIFKMYTEDFIGTKSSKEPGRQLASWLLPFATAEQRPLLSKAAAGTPVHLHWIPYDWATNGTEVPLDKHIYSVTLP